MPCPSPKTQAIRIADVVLIGPTMIVGAAHLWKGRPWLAALLGAMGVATIVYNGRNYLLLRR